MNPLMLAALPLAREMARMAIEAYVDALPESRLAKDDVARARHEAAVALAVALAEKRVREASNEG